MIAAKLLFMLFAGHALCDYPLQGDFLAKGKNPYAPLPGVPWYQCMLAHALIHGAAVYLITGCLEFGLAETATHFMIDERKCAGKFGFNVDQLLHYSLKIAWVMPFLIMGAR